MNTQTPKPWYKKKRYIIPLSLFGFILLLAGIGDSSNNSNSAQTQSIPVSAYAFPSESFQATDNVNNLETPTSTAQPAPTQTEQKQKNSQSTTTPKTYTNVSGNKVQSPTYPTSSGEVPSGASARCRDGSYSFSQHRSGTCSHHGGVAEWY